MLTLGVEQSAEDAGRLFEPRVGAGKLIEHLRREAVALLGPVDGDQEQMPPLLDPDLSVGIPLCHSRFSSSNRLHHD